LHERRDVAPRDTGRMPPIDPSRVAAQYWELYTERKQLRTTIQ
jgi:hypothetical protein